MSTETPVGVTDSQLGVLLRQTQWALDDAAHDFPAGRATPQRRVELAGTLEAMAVVLRASTPDGAEHPAGGADDERRGWCVAGCGCALEVPPSGGLFVDCSGCEPNLTQTPADHRLSDPRTPAPGDRPESSTNARGFQVEGAARLCGRPLDKSEQITGRKRDQIAARLRERYDVGATIRDLVAQTGRSYGWVRTLLLEAGVAMRPRGGDHLRAAAPKYCGTEMIAATMSCAEIDDLIDTLSATRSRTE